MPSIESSTGRTKQRGELAEVGPGVHQRRRVRQELERGHHLVEPFRAPARGLARLRSARPPPRPPRRRGGTSATASRRYARRRPCAGSVSRGRGWRSGRASGRHGRRARTSPRGAGRGGSDGGCTPWRGPNPCPRRARARPGPAPARRWEPCRGVRLPEGARRVRHTAPPPPRPRAAPRASRRGSPARSSPHQTPRPARRACGFSRWSIPGPLSFSHRLGGSRSFASELYSKRATTC